MTVSSSVTKSGPYNGNGVTTSFAYGFKIVSSDHIQVIVTENGTDQVALSSTYTVTGVGNDAGGTVVFGTAPTNGMKITLVPNIPLTQEVDLVNQGAFYAEVIEQALDLSAMRDLQLQEQIDRAILIPASDTGTYTVDQLVANILALQTQLASFGNLYYGARSSDPVLRPDGTARQNGDLFFLTTTSRLRVFVTSAWQDYIPDLGITTAKLADSSVTSAKIADGTISLTDLSATGTKVKANSLRGDNTFQQTLGSIVETIVTTPGTYTAGVNGWVKHADLIAVEVICVGAGGAGGGIAAGATGQCGVGQPGGSGGVTRKLYLAADLAATETYVVGAGGTGVSNAAGNSGGNTTFKGMTAGGGAGGNPGAVAATVAVANTALSAGGTATGGDINIPGMSHQQCARISAGDILSVPGPDGLYGSGGQGRYTNGNGLAGTGAGAAGSGGWVSGAAAGPYAGGAGANGMIIIREYRSA